jgi:thioesterase domain-containing protein
VSGLLNTLRLSSVRDSLGPLLPVRTRGTRPPTFCVHPGGGLGWCYLPLARHVPADYPLYGLQARGIDGEAPLAESVHAMAADYVEQIRQVQPHGPYHLLGYSFGAAPAHEIAVQLQALGEEVAALIIMDSYPTDEETERARTEAAEALPAGDAAWAGLIRAEFGHVLGGFSDEEVLVFARIFQNNIAIRDRHEFGRFDGDALLLVSGESTPADMPTTGRWAPHVSGEVSEAVLPCTHMDMVRPDMLGQVWQAIAAWLADPRRTKEKD